MSTLPGFTVFSPKTTIRSAEVNTNFDLLRNRGGFWYAVTLTASNLAVAAQTSTGNLLNLDPGVAITGYAVKPYSNFTGGSTTSVVISLGAGTDLLRFVDRHTISSDFTTGSYESVDLFVGDYLSTTTVNYMVESEGGNLDGLTNGLLEIYIQTSKLKE